MPLRCLEKHEVLVIRCIALIELIPKTYRLRQFLYQCIFSSVGPNSMISPNITISGASRIDIGCEVVVLQNTYLQASGATAAIQLGNRVFVSHSSDISATHDATLEIGDNTYINHHVWIQASGDIKIGRDCLIAPYVGIVAENRNFSDPTQPIYSQGCKQLGITIEDDCWLGHRVSVLDGVTIGKGSVIGAGAVVTKDIPPYSIAVGVPAKVVGTRK